ncbi:hypothetical protein Fmac_023530 [Flemingia macrophylla]|uniref:Alpha/beta hydrolase fold-3 domain-containing protein n=1 Tax=Flemingia macrophylla TaxID=520843 RepID=A0ABD1LLS7_9FABA
MREVKEVMTKEQEGVETMGISSKVDPWEHLKIQLNPGGTFTRLRGDPHSAATADPRLPIPVLTEDVSINESNKTFARIFLPRKALWLKSHADYSNCYLMGSSAGANIAYHAALRVAAASATATATAVDGSMLIRGLILSQPFFGGIERVASEVRLAEDPVLAPHVCDLLWELSLPVGADRDHEYCNPRTGQGGAILDTVKWRVLVSGCHGDPLVDHQIAFATLLQEKGLQVVSRFDHGGCHGAEVRFPLIQNNFYKLLKHFIATSSSSSSSVG